MSSNPYRDLARLLGTWESIFTGRGSGLGGHAANSLDAAPDQCSLACLLKQKLEVITFSSEADMTKAKKQVLVITTI
jgi:hypothetical protein